MLDPHPRPPFISGFKAGGSNMSRVALAVNFSKSSYQRAVQYYSHAQGSGLSAVQHSCKLETTVAANVSSTDPDKYDDLIRLAKFFRELDPRALKERVVWSPQIESARYLFVPPRTWDPLQLSSHSLHEKRRIYGHHGLTVRSTLPQKSSPSSRSASPSTKACSVWNVVFVGSYHVSECEIH